MFYSPNQVVEAFSTATLEWDPHCFDSANNIDIYLQSLDVAQPIHVWKNVVASSAKLSSSPPPTCPYGPIFFAHFNGSIPASAPTSAHDGKQLGGPSIEYITNLFHRSHHALSGENNNNKEQLSVPLFRRPRLRSTASCLHSALSTGASTHQSSNMIISRMEYSHNNQLLEPEEF
ncbi:hypothetical protein PGTUg99_001983 [Puccinia graminis f. sp. tritici]|uniref:Uncharacterized protein n=1 Tax=Puccinia graminis f. sp. tritici TaxID=56615 RepID=A0A5B0RTE5_PUCGR|nr:hypothetical protein PGTUg99_022186 [Puccinia graminis f. sp. tritici]KAA1134505.1 hypothetical protein PGTUg99_001983 [Puccinia graminis f. sp. tritici]